ncbi:MAG: HAMP domain-containing histidine kinase [Burkholderiales bacterium]|nr:HAMP domain-containing histidine kinase [Burkholderiales bacterium]
MEFLNKKMTEERKPEPFPECVVCAYKVCEKTPIWQLDVCQFGISHVNDGEKIQKQNASVTLRHLSQNLRHELHKFLQIIINEASAIDPKVSAKNVSIGNPTGRIVAASVMLDNIVEMISGVNDFHPDPDLSTHKKEPRSLTRIIQKYDRIYSLLKNPRRPSELRINVQVPENLEINFGTDIIEYLLAVFIDNARKYALPEVDVVRVYSEPGEEPGLIDLIFENPSQEISETNRIFDKGYQQDSESEGFGFGLFWAKILADHYNRILGDATPLLSVNHEQSYIDVDNRICKQCFTIRNLRVCTQ